MAMKPKRIQLSRRKGYRKPADAVVVARPTKWGNPFKVGEPMELIIQDHKEAVITPASTVSCVFWFAHWLLMSEDGKAMAQAARRELRGKDLACWCPLDRACHADILIDIAANAIGVAPAMSAGPVKPRFCDRCGVTTAHQGDRCINCSLLNRGGEAAH